jgi:hypothetical protein
LRSRVAAFHDTDAPSLEDGRVCGQRRETVDSFGPEDVGGDGDVQRLLAAGGGSGAASA